MHKWIMLGLAVTLAACQPSGQNSATDKKQISEQEKNAIDLTADRISYMAPYIPPQCYTNPVDKDTGTVSNPCYACHTGSKEPNYLNDLDAQLVWGFPEAAEDNHWLNVFKDRTQNIAAISDDDILKYVREDNYFDASGRKIALAEKLKNVPATWDRDKNGQWDGYVPDVWFNFDQAGFDYDPQGKPTGWRVFAYYPFLGTFMPTNGSTDDVMIRLPQAFRELQAGQYDEETYRVNLAIVEALIKKQDVSIPEVDENRYGVDLDKNGELGKTTLVRYDWAPLENRNMSYVGVAGKLGGEQKEELAAGMYPVGTEFVHTVRYLDVDAQGNTRMARRMKELRYGRKDSWRTYYNLRHSLEKEIKERHDFPERTKQVIGNMETGMVVTQGWVYQGFIEDAQGALRPQSYQENYFCVGCHSGIGAITDTTFSFERKFNSADSWREGWYHWMEKGLEGIADPIREDGKGEYAFYLEKNPSGNEYRTNTEVKQKFFDEKGQEKPQAFAELQHDIAYLLMPSAERALKLNKAYKVIVDEQSYAEGRDAVIEPLSNIQKEIEVGTPTGIKEALSFY